MQENIIGYLLGALDDNEMAEFEAELERNDDLQLRVQDAARSLQVLDDQTEDEPPPIGLVESTCQRVQAVSVRATSRTRNRQLVPATDSWSLFDVVVAASVMIVGCLLFFPAINSSRMHAQIAGCQDNLRVVGNALIGYSEHCPKRAFPQIPNTMETGVAGIYAPLLMEAGFITDDQRFHCPSSTRIDLAKLEAELRIPRIADFTAANGPDLCCLQERAGGDYGYILGYVKNGRLQAVRNECRRNYALVTDHPVCEIQPGHRILKHRNVLFECGSVRVFPLNMQEWNGDNFFENANGQMQAGVNKNDTVIGPSSARPLPLK